MCVSLRIKCGKETLQMANTKGAKALTTNELEKAKVLSASGMSFRQIGRELGRSDKTVKKALTKTPEIIQEVQEIKEQLAGMFEDIAKRMIASIKEADITKLDAYRRTLSAGIATDKAAALRNTGQGGQIQIVIRTVFSDTVGELPQVIDIKPSAGESN